MTKVKICGITNLDDGQLAVRLGADALGFNFYRKSPRYVPAALAKEITLKLGDTIHRVGVFVDDSVDEMMTVVDSVGLDIVQLHGDESAAFVSELRKRFRGGIVKAFSVSPDFHQPDLFEYEVDGVLLDGYSTDLRGGTGETFDWSIARAVGKLIPALWLAGGLTPENVGRAIAEVRPFAVDACSSIESEPGVKDAAKLERFIKAAKEA